MTLTLQKSGMHGINYGAEGTANLLLPSSWSTDNLIIVEDENTFEASYPINLLSDEYFMRLTVEQNNDTTL